MKKTSLSYTTMNALIHEPHTWINKQMGLKTFENQYMTEGKAAHRIIQDHVSGKTIHDILKAKNLPTFETVEQEEWDKNLKVTFDIDDKYYFTGFLDGKDLGRGDLLEIKTGKPWSAGEFARLVQWKLYGLGEPKYKKIWLVNTPRNPEEWHDGNIKIYNKDIDATDLKAAQEFIDKAISVIETIKDQTLEVEGRSKWCYYIGCEFCKEKGGN